MTDAAEPAREAPPRPKNPVELRLELPAVHAAARMARHLVRTFARSGGIVGRDLDNLVLVASELLGNAVDHGGGGAAMVEEDLDKPVRMGLFMRVSSVSWELSVSDQGGGDPEVVDGFLHPDGLPDLEDDRGRGFFLMAQMVDDMSVDKSEDGLGLALKAVKRLGDDA